MLHLAGLARHQGSQPPRLPSSRSLPGLPSSAVHLHDLSSITALPGTLGRALGQVLLQDPVLDLLR